MCRQRCNCFPPVFCVAVQLSGVRAGQTLQLDVQEAAERPEGFLGRDSEYAPPISFEPPVAQPAQPSISPSEVLLNQVLTFCCI